MQPFSYPRMVRGSDPYELPRRADLLIGKYEEAAGGFSKEDAMLAEIVSNLMGLAMVAALAVAVMS